MRERAKGAFIVLEGLDGAGTTTQLERLAAVLKEAGRDVVATCEPSSGPVGSLIRQALQGRVTQPGGSPLSDAALALLFAADRMDHLAAEVEPALRAGAVVLCDRYVLSSLAYQGAALPMEWVARLNARARVPDLTLFFEVSPKAAAQRRARRGGRPELYESQARQREIWAQYRRAVAMAKATQRIVVLDGEPPPAEVTRAAVAAIRRELKVFPPAGRHVA